MPGTTLESVARRGRSAPAAQPRATQRTGRNEQVLSVLGDDHSAELDLRLSDRAGALEPE